MGKPQASAPLGPYLDAVRCREGMLVLDDTQALGILGKAPTRCHFYGQGGGGSLRWQAIQGPDIISIASLSKGFGVPLAILAGSSSTVRRFEAHSETRMHCSPPAVPVLLAAAHALDVNHTHGDELRLRLLKRVLRFREGLANAGVASKGGLFPVQNLAGVHGQVVVELYSRLRQVGVRTVLQGDNGEAGARISFVITAQHSVAEIDKAVRVIVRLGSEPRIAWINRLIPGP